jgi:hypothetical protein
MAARCNAGSRLYKADPRPRGLHFFPFALRARVSAAAQCTKKARAPPSLGLPPPCLRMRTKSLVTFTSKCTGFEESKMEKAQIRAPFGRPPR